MYKDQNMRMDNARCRSTIKDAKDLNCMISPYNSKIGNVPMCNIKIFQDINDLSKHFSTNTAPMTVGSIKDIKVFTTNTGCRYAIYTSGNLENCLNIINIDRECGVQYKFLNAYDIKVKDVLWYDDTSELKIACAVMCPDIDIDQLPFDINCTSADEILVKDNFFFRSEYIRELFFAHVKFNHYEVPIIFPEKKKYDNNTKKNVRLKRIKSRAVKLKRSGTENDDTKIEEKKNLNRDICSLRSSFTIKNNDEVITTIYRFDNEADPIFSRVTFRGKEYIFTNKTPYHLTIINVTDREEYSKKLEYNGCSIMPISMYVDSEYGDKDICLVIKALCTHTVDGIIDESTNKIFITIKSLDKPFEFTDVRIRKLSLDNRNKEDN